MCYVDRRDKIWNHHQSRGKEGEKKNIKSYLVRTVIIAVEEKQLPRVLDKSLRRSGQDHGNEENR
jgi:hypothetical protein